MSSVYETVKQSHGGLLRDYRARAADGLIEPRDVLAAIHELVDGLVAAVEQIQATGPQKKQAVLQLVMEIWDHDLSPIKVAGLDRLIDPGLRAGLHPAVDFAIELAVFLNNKLGWPGESDAPKTRNRKPRAKG